MLAKRLVLLSAWITASACARPDAVPSTAADLDRGAHDAPPAPCGDDGGVAAPSPAPRAFERAHDRVRADPAWGRLEPEIPAGFRALTDQDLADDRINGALSEPRATDRVGAWVLEREDGPAHFTVVEMGRYAARPTKEETLFRYAVRVHGGFQAGEVSAELTDAALERWFNRVETIRDERGREIVEWAYVVKGCERAEVFERFVEDDVSLLRVSLVVEATARDDELAEWLARFFDAPFAAPAAANRASLTGRATPR